MPLPKIVRYVLSGGTAAVTNLLLLFLLVQFAHVHYLIASVLAFLVAFGVSFTLQKFWTFQDRETAGTHVQVALYLLITLGNLCVNTFLVYTFVAWLGVWYLLAQLIAGALVALYSYVVYQKFVFGNKVVA